MGTILASMIGLGILGSSGRNMCEIMNKIIFFNRKYKLQIVKVLSMGAPASPAYYIILLNYSARTETGFQYQIQITM